jgi:PAS domain S-box-containing protein
MNTIAEAKRPDSTSGLQASEIRYRRLFEAARDGILILDPVTRKITDANPFMSELLDYPHEELLGKELWEIGLLKDEEHSRAAYRELQEKQFIRYEDLPLQTKAGVRRDVEFVSNLYNEDGRNVIQCNIRDITERKRVEEALHLSHERFRALFELVPIAIYSCDTSGVIQEFNRHATELWGRKPALGDTDERFCGSFKLFRPDGSFMPHEQCPMAEVVSGKIPAVRDAEVLIERPGGSRVVVVVNIHPLKNERGEIAGAINCF